MAVFRGAPSALHLREHFDRQSGSGGPLLEGAQMCYPDPVFPNSLTDLAQKFQFLGCSGVSIHVAQLLQPSRKV